MDTNKTEKIKEVEGQIDSFLSQMRELMISKIGNAYNAAPDEFLVVGKDNALLAKAVFDSVCRERPCSPLSYKKEFENIHRMI